MRAHGHAGLASAPRLGGQKHWQGNDAEGAINPPEVTHGAYFLGASAGGSAGLDPRNGVVSPMGNPERAE